KKDYAVIEITESLILMLDKRVAQAKAMLEVGIGGTKWCDDTLDFLAVGGPQNAGLDMSEENFHSALESNLFINLPETFDSVKFERNFTNRVLLFTCASNDGDRTVGRFYWTGSNQIFGTQDLAKTCEFPETMVDEWAEMIGYTETLRKVRKGELIQ
ncbi:hypothetical protein LCGC14_1952610, partial [marine sediment metagenome]